MTPLPLSPHRTRALALVVALALVAGGVATAQAPQQLPGRTAQDETPTPYLVSTVILGWFSDGHAEIITETPTPYPTYTPTPSKTPFASVTPPATFTPAVVASSTPTATYTPTSKPSGTPPIEATPTPEVWTVTPTPRPACYGTVTTAVLNVRDQPYGTIISQIKSGDRKEVVGYWDDDYGYAWYAIFINGTELGFIHSSYVALEDTPDCDTLPNVEPVTHEPLFGLHIVMPINSAGELGEFITAMNARGKRVLVKCVHCPELTNLVLANNGVMINRFKVASGYLGDCTRPGDLTAAQAVQEQLDRHMQFFDPHYINQASWVEIDNECMEYWDDMAWLDEYLSLLIKRVRTEYGRTLVVLSPLAGDWTPERVRALPQTWDAMLEYDAVLGMHAYGIDHTLTAGLSVGYLQPYVRQHVQVMETLKSMNPAYGAIRIVYTEAGSYDGWQPFRPDDCARWFNVIRHDPGIAGIACWTGGGGTAVYSASGRYVEIVEYLD